MAKYVKTKPKIIFFDWDDTLSDAGAGLKYAIIETFKKYQHLIQDELAEDFTQKIKTEQGRKELLSQIKPGTGGESLVKKFFKHSHDEIIKYSFKVNNEYIEKNGFQPKPDAVECIKFLTEQQNIKVIIISNKDQKTLDYEINRSGLRPLILASYGVTDYKDENKKPSPYYFKKALSDLNLEDIKPEETWMVGDSELDILAAKNFGSIPFFLGDKYGITLDLYEDDYIDLNYTMKRRKKSKLACLMELVGQVSN